MSQYLDDPAPPAYAPQTPSGATQCHPETTHPCLAAVVAIGWQDLRTQVVNNLFYGVAFWGMAMVLGLVFRNSPEFTMTLVSGSRLISPFPAPGLYEISRHREVGLLPSFIGSVTCWRGHLRSMSLLVGVSLLLPWGVGLLLVGPLLGHASWHAYRSSVRWLTA